MLAGSRRIQPGPEVEPAADVAAELMRLEARGASQAMIAVPPATTLRMLQRLAAADLIEIAIGSQTMVQLTHAGAKLARTAHAKHAGAML